MPQLLDYQHIALVGVKGVGVTALAQCLLDLNKDIVGFDVAEEFVTSAVLRRRQVKILDLADSLPESCQMVIYSAAYDPEHHPLLISARQKKLPVVTLAQAVAELFNQKDGIAVCGVGGKSSVSAWIIWLLHQLGQEVSGVVGVGSIAGLDFTGIWRPNSQYFVAEADEYARNPMAVRRGEPLIPRFAGLEPTVIVCTNLSFDHPDVYRDLTHTKQVFGQFFRQLRAGGILIYNQDDDHLVQLAQALKSDRPDIRLISFGQNNQSDVQWLDQQIVHNQSHVKVKINHDQINSTVEYDLKIPGRFFAANSMAVLATGLGLGLEVGQILPALTSFASVARRFEDRGQWQGVKLLDDYAHTPQELSQAIQAIRQITPGQVIVCFQPHTFSRSKAYLSEFSQGLALADYVILLPIFPSAREALDPTTSSDQIVRLLQDKSRPVQLSQDFSQAVNLIKQVAKPGDTLATLGAGDVYQVIDLLKGQS